MLLAGVGVQQHRLGQGHQAGAEHALEQAEGDYLFQALGRAAEHRGQGETDDAPHEQALAAEARGEEAGQRHADS
ncbi:hypothetical protein D3C81_2219670 [compost metagenome]